MIFDAFDDIITYILEYLAGLFTGVTIISTIILVVGIILFALNLGLWIMVYFNAKKRGMLAWAIFTFGWLFTGLFGVILYFLCTSRLQISKDKKTGKILSSCYVTKK